MNYLIYYLIEIKLIVGLDKFRNYVKLFGNDEFRCLETDVVIKEHHDSDGGHNAKVAQLGSNLYNAFANEDDNEWNK